MERNINIKIDIDDRAPTSYNDLIKVGDSINLTIDLLSKGESVDLRDSSVELFLKKEDGTKVEQEVIIGDSKVSCTPLNIQSTTVVGQVCGELVVESSGKQVTSSTFIFNVEGSTSSEILEESKDDIATIKSLQNTIVNVNSVVEKYKTNIEAIAGTSESIEALAQIKIYAESAVTEIETVVNTGNTLKTSLESENTRAENNIQELNNLGSESIKTHINNTDIHVAASDKTKWDSYEQLISDNASHLNEKANLSDVKIFTSLSDIGLSLDDMTTDFGSNILKMIKAMGRNRKLVLYPYSAETNTNLYNSVKTWCEVNTDAYTLVIESSFNGAENLPNKIEVYPNTNTGNNRYFVGFYDNAMGKCREVAGLDSSISLPLRSTLVEYEGVASGYSNKIIKKDNGIIIIHFCVKKSDGSGIKANELLFIADIPVGYRIKSTFGVASAWAGFKPSLPYLDSGNVLVCRVTEDCTAVVGNIIGEAI